MNQIKIKRSQKGFTLIEILLVIALIGILLSISLVSFNTEARFIDARNDTRKTHIQTLESAITQYRLQEGNYPTGLSRNYQEICDPEATDCIGFFDLKQFLVPTYLQAIPQDPNDTDTTGGSGYSVAVDEATNTVSVRAIQSEGDVIININDPLLAEPTTITNTPLAATVPVTPPPPIVTNGLVLHLDAGNTASYPGTGNTWFDLSGNGRNGTLINGVGYNSGNLGALSFDGVNDHITFASNPLLTNQITVEVWVNLNSTTPNGTAWILGREGSYRLIYSSGSLAWVCSTVNNGWYTTGTNISTSISSTSGIYHVVGTYNGSNIQIYVNGSLRATGSSISGNILTNGSYNLFRSDAGNVDYGKGNLYVHRIYNRSLTPEEIQQNFNATRGRFGL